MPKTLLIVWHSQGGGTRQMLDAVLDGARTAVPEAIEIRTRPALEATPGDVLSADAILLGTPENFGYMSGALKYFFDRCYHACLEHTQGRPYAVFIRAGNDGRGALASIERIVTGLRWREVAEPVVLVGELDAAGLAACAELGATLAAGLDAGVF